MRRDTSIPLFLWIATAIVAHLLGGGGVDRASQAMEERIDVRRFALAVRQQVRGEGEGFEVSLVEQDAPLSPSPTPPATATPSPTESQEPTEPTEPEAAPEPKAPRTVPEPPAPAPPPPPPPPPAATQPPPAPPAAPTPTVELPPAKPQGRIAVKQHVEDEQQPDNPNATHIADQANHVKEETRARITANDANDPKPTPGSAPTGPQEAPGNAEDSRVASAEERRGAEEATASQGEPPRAPAPPRAAARSESQRPSEPGAHGAQDGSETAPRPGSTGAEQSVSARARREALDKTAETVNTEQGTSAVAAAREGQQGQRARRARKKRLPPPKGRPDALGLLGLGASGTSLGGMNLNLSPRAALSSIGRDQLERERRSDTERRKSAHRGSWKPVGLEKWRAAIENYVASVKPGNQTALNTARVPFASYLNDIHQRLHPLFADSFLDSLDALPASHPLNQPELRTNVEIVVSREDGRLVKLGVTRASGVTAFDVAALEAVSRAAPFGAPPAAIVSPDGNVYLHWEFYRDRNYACSTYFARPFLLKLPPRSVPPKVSPPADTPRDSETTTTGARERPRSPRTGVRSGTPPRG